MSGALFIGKVWPEPASSAAGSRAMQLLNLLSEQYQPVFCASAASQGPYSAQFSGTGIVTLPINLNSEQFDESIRDLQPELVVFDRFTTEEQYGWRVAEQCPQALRVLDTEDLHGLREARKIALNAGRQPAPEDLLNDIALREAAAILRSDLSLIISSAEMEILTTTLHIPPELLHYTPYLHEELTAGQADKWPGFNDRHGFMFIGNFRHEPNADAVMYLKREIWPHIRRLMNDAGVTIYGAYATEEIMSLSDPRSGFRISGRTAEASEAFTAARVNLAPLRFGAGLKGKVSEGWRCGTPCVATSTASEGIDNVAWPGHIVEQPQQFAEAAVQLYQNEDEWNKMQDRCRAAHNQLFSISTHGPALMARLSELSENIEGHRLRHFTGAVLRHQQFHASRWLGKYIETKNRLTADESNADK